MRRKLYETLHIRMKPEHLEMVLLARESGASAKLPDREVPLWAPVGAIRIFCFSRKLSKQKAFMSFSRFTRRKPNGDHPCDHTRSGFCTRFLPASKAIPKELIPVVDKPTIQYVVEEAVEAGIREILIIISKGKEAICSHFESNPELRLSSSKRASMKP